MQRKQEYMYAVYGISEGHTCALCTHLKHHWYHDKSYYKCEVYGDSSSEATDWRKKWTACGAYNDDSVTRRDVYRNISHVRTGKDPEPLEGQMMLEVNDADRLN